MTLLRLCAVAATLLVAPLLVAGCSTTFRPLEASGRVPSDMAAAEYSLAHEAVNVGAAQVWLESPPDDGSQLVRLGLRIRNEGDSTVRLDLNDTELEVRTKTGELYVVSEIQALLGDEVVKPRTTGRMELNFMLPGDLTMGDLAGFELLWAVASDDGTRITRTTTFVPETWQQSQDRRYMR